MSDIYLPWMSTIQVITGQFVKELLNLDNYGKYFTIEIVVDDIQWVIVDHSNKTLLSIDLGNRSLNGIRYTDDMEYIEAVARCLLSLTGYLSGMWNSYPTPIDKYNLRIVGFGVGAVELSVKNLYTSLAYGECLFSYVVELAISPSKADAICSIAHQFSIQPMVSETIGSVQFLSRMFSISPRETVEQTLQKA